MASCLSVANEGFDLIIYIFYSPEMVAAKKNTKEENQKNTQITKAKARKTNMHCRLFS